MLWRGVVYSMKIDLLNCPACGSPVDVKFNPNQPFRCPACGSAIVLTNWTKSGKIICSSCNTLNSEFNKYCDACDALLQAGCPMCYTQNSLTDLHCKNCGIDLQKAWRRQQSWLAQREKHASERKQALEKAEQEHKDYLNRLLLKLNEPENHPEAIAGIRIFGKEAVESLIQLLASEDPDARYGAAQILGDIGDERAIPCLLSALGDKEIPVRFWAVDALGKFGDKGTINAIAAMLQDDSEVVRNMAKNVLIQMGSPEALKKLQKESRPKWWFPFS